MRAHVQWPEQVDQAPVYIEIGKSADEILQIGYISTKLKDREVQTLGIMLDADTKLKGRYERIRNQCLTLFPALPKDLPVSGLVAENLEQKRVGVWIMPDNASEGSIEMFLRYLVPNESEPVWKHATESVARALEMGAPCRNSHIPKANLYTWLAWQDPPGQSPGIALTKKILDPHSPTADVFVHWFRTLYEL